MHVEVFLSYAREDIDLAKQIIAKLEDDEIKVWWDNKITLDSGDFTSEIEEAILAAQCFLVLWSENSTKSDWVKEEATFAKKNKPKIVQVGVGDIRVPLGFKLGQCKKLTLKKGQISRDSLSEIARDIKEIIGIQGPKEHLVRSKVVGKNWDFGDLAIETPVPGLDIFLSFRPCGNSGVFLLMRLETTDGWVRSDIPSAVERHKPYESDGASTYEDSSGHEFLKVNNDIFFIMDPLRPYGIQIGGLRSKRPSANPGTISGDIPIDQLRALPTQLEWVSMTLAEILSTEESLKYLWNKVDHQSEWNDESKEKIKQLISKNPNAPREIQESLCLFCDKVFKEKRKLSSADKETEYGAYVIANDFPFGPAFHYLAITEEPVHSWEELTYKQIKGLNLIIHDFLQTEENKKGAAGVSFGFNSTIRHLILGRQTQSSAGASIPHVHKQAWGMAQRTANLAERLIEVSQAYWNHNVDYQGAYIEALREAGYIIWEDKNVALYVPYGQCSKYELQAIVLNPRGCLTELSQDEVISLSKAEYIALRLFKSLEINSFNHVILSKLYNETRAPKFRLVEAFITREIDLAVSELSMLFVVDQHPWDSRNEIMPKWEDMKDDVCMEMGCED
jgi:galactose-1-phosphate uridylyltransferase